MLAPDRRSDCNCPKMFTFPCPTCVMAARTEITSLSPYAYDSDAVSNNDGINALVTKWKVIWESTTPRESDIWGFCRQHLATLATPTIRSIKCKQSPVYGVFWPLLPHHSTDRNETRNWSSLSPWEPSHKIWYKSVHILFSYHGRRQTHKPTPVKHIPSLSPGV